MRSQFDDSQGFPVRTNRNTRIRNTGARSGRGVSRPCACSGEPGDTAVSTIHRTITVALAVARVGIRVVANQVVAIVAYGLFGSAAFVHYGLLTAWAIVELEDYVGFGARFEVSALVSTIVRRVGREVCVLPRSAARTRSRGSLVGSMLPADRPGRRSKRISFRIRRGSA